MGRKTKRMKIVYLYKDVIDIRLKTKFQNRQRHAERHDKGIESSRKFWQFCRSNLTDTSHISERAVNFPIIARKRSMGFPEKALVSNDSNYCQCHLHVMFIT